MIHAIILAGGSGTRFWPVSKRKKPKPFIQLLKDPLLTQTIKRIKGIKAVPWIVANVTHKKWVMNLKEDIPHSHLLFEPEAKDTMSALIWATLSVLKEDPEATLLVLPADQLISPLSEFKKTLKNALPLSESAIVTIGIRPEYANTGYGYIHTKNQDVMAFKEKPNETTAKTYVKNPEYYWNSGILLAKGTYLLSLIEKTTPDMLKIIRQWMTSKNKELFETLPKISFDYALLEKNIPHLKCVPAKFKWEDLGSFRSLIPHLKKDADNNASQSPLVTINSKNNLIYGNKKLIALIDIENLTVIQTDDILLILPTDSDQKIKALQTKLGKTYQ